MEHRVPVKRVRRDRASQIVRRDLIRLVKQGEFPDGALPSEDSLATMFGVSRITIRDALANLENLGYISRIQGRGTVINPIISTMKCRISEGQPFFTILRSLGYEPAVTGGRVEKLPMEEDVRHKLRSRDAQMYRVEKLFTADGRPAIYGVNYFSEKYLNDNIFNYPMDEKIIFGLLQERFEFPEIAYDLIDILPFNADALLSEKLGLPEGKALLFLEAVSMDGDYNPLLINREYYNPDIITFREVRSAHYDWTW